jgi:hypothetical protein
MLKNYFFSASAAHTSQPCQGNLGGLLVKPCSDRLVDHIAGITALATGAVGGAYALWPRPLEQQLRLPPEAVRECVAGIAEVPTEYAARKLYRECLVAARDRIDFENRLPAWTEYNRQMREWAACIPTAGRSCPPEPQKPPAQGW